MATMNIWALTWQQVLEMGQERNHTLVDYRGYLVASADRKLDPRQARNMYLENLKWAIRKGLKLSTEILESEAEVIDTIRTELAKRAGKETQKAEGERPASRKTEQAVEAVPQPVVAARVAIPEEEPPVSATSGQQFSLFDLPSERPAMAAQGH